MEEAWWQKRERQNREEVVKHLQGKPSQVKNGRLDGRDVKGLAGGGATYNGDTIRVSHGAVFRNGTYEGETR